MEMATQKQEAVIEAGAGEFKNTRIGRTLRTLAQAFIAIAPLFIAVVAIPEVQTFVANNVVWLVPLLPPAVAIVTFLYNYIQDKAKAAVAKTN